MEKEELKAVSDLEAISHSRHFFYENAFYLTSPASRIKKLLVHYELFKMTLDVPGDIVECGVFKGASLSRFAKFRDIFQQTSSKKVIGFDVFEGFPLPEEQEDIACRERFIMEAGEQSISEERLKGFLKASGVSKNLELVKGDVLETLPAYLDRNPAFKISLLNIDIDLYKPTLDCLKYLYERVEKGGVILLDDYNGFPGATKAIDEFFTTKNGIKITTLPWSASPSYIIKG